MNNTDGLMSFIRKSLRLLDNKKILEHNNSKVDVANELLAGGEIITEGGKILSKDGIEKELELIVKVASSTNPIETLCETVTWDNLQYLDINLYFTLIGYDIVKKIE